MSVMASSRDTGRHLTAGFQRQAAANAVLVQTWPRILDVIAVTGPMVFLAVTVFLENAQPDFSPARDTISSLVWGRFGWAQTAAFFVMALSMIATAVRLAAVMGLGRASRLGQALLTLIGVAFAIIAIFPTASPLGPSGIQNAVHQDTVRAMSVLFPLVCMVVSNSLRLSYPTLRGYTAATAMVAVALIPAGALAAFTDAPWLGAIERIILGNGLLWVEVVAIQLMLVGRHASASCCRPHFEFKPERSLSGRPVGILVPVGTTEVLKDARKKGNF